nr:acyl-CoA dehydrogenase family protein [Sporichthya sp.]
MIAAQAYACAQRALDLTVDWCRLRTTFGQPLISRQLVQHQLVEMARQIEVARVYTREVAVRYAAGGDCVTEVCFAKNTAVAAGEWVVNEALQLHGGLGYMREAEVERQYRDMRILGIGGGTSEILARARRPPVGLHVLTMPEVPELKPKVWRMSLPTLVASLAVLAIAIAIMVSSWRDRDSRGGVVEGRSWPSP